jgi:sirohydrochlorin cobaltochelatase
MHAIHDSALVLVGHGSSVNETSSKSLDALVARLRQRDCFGQVRAVFYKEGPSLKTAFRGLAQRRVFVVPFFVSAGYFSEEVVPRELGFRVTTGQPVVRVRACEGQRRFYCHPVGTHDLMTHVILSRSRSVVEDHPFPSMPPEREITLFIAGHGTERNPDSRRSVERQADLIRKRGLYAAVQAVFLEEHPQIADCPRIARTRYLVVVPFFLSDGLHVCEDIPVLLGEPERVVQQRLSRRQPTWRNPTEHHGKLIWYSGAVGTDPVMVEVILERVKEAAGW